MPKSRMAGFLGGVDRLLSEIDVLESPLPESAR